MTAIGIGRYTRRHRIATGGMGEVWLAHDEVLNRDVAVKYLKQEYADDDGFRTRFLNEARSAASLLHPGIATVFDFGEGGGTGSDDPPYLVMEYVDGHTLSELLATGRPLDPEQARDVVAQAGVALGVAHAAGLVHRDVKPGNLMVTPDGIVKITDFGIARAGDGMALTETGQLLGTPQYISPEQAAGSPATAASDVYALGVVLFECLTGRRPFEADSPVATALAQVRDPVPELPPEVPRALADVTRRALAKKPGDRYPDASAFAAALAALAPEPTIMMSAPVAAPPDSSPLIGRPGRAGRMVRGHERALLLVAAALAVAIIGVLAATALMGEGTKDTPPGSPTSSPSVSPTSPARVNVDPAAYVGEPVAQVREQLARLDLDTRVETIANPDGRTAGTVATVQPNGAVAVGSTVTLQVWGDPPKSGGDDGGKDNPGKGKGKGKGNN